MLLPALTPALKFDVPAVEDIKSPANVTLPASATTKAVALFPTTVVLPLL